MGKISGYQYNISPSTSDFLIGDSASGPITYRYSISTLINTALITIPCKFSYGLSGNINATSASMVIPFNYKIFDTGGNYSAGSSIFTVATTGYYWLSAAVSAGSNNGIGYYIELVKNSNVLRKGNAYIASAANSGGYNVVTLSCLEILNAGDQLVVQWVGTNSGNYTILGNVSETYFQAMLVATT